MNILLNWTDLDGRRLPDGDRIESAISAPDYPEDDPRRVSVVVRLELGPGLDWWKMVELTTFNRTRMASAEVDGRNPGTECVAQIWPPANGARWLTLWKAKVAGVHTPMYDLTDIGFLKGKVLNLRWIKD
jgi:hypothetical protein